jgi:hypothetical protein
LVRHQNPLGFGYGFKRLKSIHLNYGYKKKKENPTQHLSQILGKLTKKESIVIPDLTIFI